MRSAIAFLLVMNCGCLVLFAEDQGESALSVFRQRIEPIWKSPKPSSCSECHLSGVDLKDYLREDQGATFAALRDAGLIDLKQPDESKLLKFVARKPARPSLVTDKVRQQEFEALREWIRLAVKDPELLKSKPNADTALNLPPVEVIRHTRQDHVLSSFVDNVWSEVGRCAACHSPDRNGEQVKKYGDKVSWIKPRDPAGTLAYLLEAKLIDVKLPEESPLVLKPTMQISHGGGQKMEIGDRTYKQFMVFLADYEKVVHGKYQKPEELPKPRTEVSQVSDIWLKIEGVPEVFDKKLLQVDIFFKDKNVWTRTPVAVGDRAIFGPKQLWQQHLTVVAPIGSERAKQILKTPSLLPGRYRVRIMIDQDDHLKKIPTAVLDRRDQVAEIEINTNWPTGYGNMTVIQFPQDRVPQGPMPPRVRPK